MYIMQSSSHDFRCPQCRMIFKEAAMLLQHVSMHAADDLLKNATSQPNPQEKKLRTIPDLYPINEFKFRKAPKSDTDVESDSGVEDVNPMKFCMVTMSETNKTTKKVSNNFSNTVKRYPCTYCSKRFGWSTDLKRHILTHTGEKPFPCQLCDSAFTRNFLLIKHQKKCHSSEEKIGLVPDLKPLKVVTKSRKQEKTKIVRIPVNESVSSADK